jgi:nucleoside-diphosphate-sugar epimerase
MRILVTGASGFVGAHLCLAAAGAHEVWGLHHATALDLPGVTPVKADLRRGNTTARLRALRPDWVVHAACKIKGPDAAAQSAAMMDTVLGVGLPVLYLSSTVVGWVRPTAYGRARAEDERRLMQSGLPYAILRPSAPYGPRLAHHRPRHTESFHTLAQLVERSPVVPLIGDGAYRRQPVHVRDLAAAALALIDRGGHPTPLEAGGPAPLAFREIVAQIAAAAGTRPRLLPLPKALFVRLAALRPDFEPELIAAVDADELADPGPLRALTGTRPRPFSPVDLLRGPRPGG